ncbi:MAG: hypothetical protein M3O85_04720 [Acidobacteriota bacterium]|nr:hypothetical protein [Acidobacteriota bacterium]
MKFNFMFNTRCQRLAARLTLLGLALLLAAPASGQESPYFVAYDDHMEEPGNLEVSVFSTTGIRGNGQPAYFAPFTEIEYGVTAWWTAELYLEGQSTLQDSTIFTGWRLENRWRPLARQHRINPVLYFEYENLNEGSRIKKEIVGHAGPATESNTALRREHVHELEAKLILSSQVKGWNVSENFIVEKNLSANEGVEFGYALGVSRPLASLVSSRNCRLCRENFAAGLELYGGLGDSRNFGLKQTSHYLAPALSWRVSDSTTLRFSTGFGLTSNSAPVLLRFGYSYEVRGFRDKVAALFRKTR